MPPLARARFAARSLAAAITLAALPAAVLAGEDDMIRVKSSSDVPTTVERLASAAENAGATVFARVDHGAGAQRVGKDIGPSVAVIFGNPAAGTPVMEQNRLAGAMLPLQVLVYQDTDGAVWLAHEDLGERLDDLDGIDEDDAAVKALDDALEKLVRAAAG